MSAKKLTELFSDSLIYGISSVLARFINYLLVPLHTKVFSTGQYGIVGLIYASITFLNVLFTAGMESAYLRYAKDRDEAGSIFKTIQLSLLGFATILSLLLWLFAPFIMPLMSLDPATKNIYLMMVGIIWFDTLAVVPFAELRLVRKAWQYAAIRTANIIIVVGLNFYLILQLQWGIQAVFVANLAASALTTIFLWFITTDLWDGQWNSTIAHKAILFGLPFVPAGLGYAINEVLDRFFLNNYLSPATAASLYGAGTSPQDVVGIYAASYKLAVFMLLLIQMFRQAWQPFFLRHANDEEASALFGEVFFYFNLAAAAVFLFVALFMRKIVQIRLPIIDAYLIGPKFWSGLTIVPILLGAYWFHGWYMNFSAGAFIQEKTGIFPKITIFGSLVTIIANLLLVPFFGMMGAAWATLISYCAMAFALYIQTQRIFPVSYPLVKVLLMMAWVASCWLIEPNVAHWVSVEWKAELLMATIGLAGLVGFFRAGPKRLPLAKG